MGYNDCGHDDKGALEELASFINTSDVEESDESSGELYNHKMYCTTYKRGHEQKQKHMGN